ncbi:MAG: UMP kinase [archaeon]
MFEFFDQALEEKEKQESSESTYSSDLSDSNDSSNSSSSYSSYSSYQASGKTIVFSVGGSLLGKEKLDLLAITKLCTVLNDLTSQGHKIVLAVGGGKLARELIASIKSAGGNYFQQDLAGIQATKANALIIINLIEKAFHEPLDNFTRIKEVFDSGKIPVVFGMLPGTTTDGIAALTAEFLKADLFVNLTNVSGIYSGDPKREKNVILLDSMDYNKLIKLVLTYASVSTGCHVPFDLFAATIVKRSNIKALVLNGNNTENLLKAVRGEQFIGTTISSV